MDERAAYFDYADSLTAKTREWYDEISFARIGLVWKKVSG